MPTFIYGVWEEFENVHYTGGIAINVVEQNARILQRPLCAMDATGYKTHNSDGNGFLGSARMILVDVDAP